MINVLSAGLFVLSTSAAAGSSERLPLPPSGTNVAAVELNCETNEQDVKALQAAIVTEAEKLHELRSLRAKKNLSEEQNSLLFKGEFEISGMYLLISVRQYFQYYCDNPDKIPVPPVDPNTVS